MNEALRHVAQDTLLYVEFGERRRNAGANQPMSTIRPHAVAEQLLSLMERHDLHNIVGRHFGNIVESVSQRLVITFSRPDGALACARDLRAAIQRLRESSIERIGLYARMLLLPAPPDSHDPSRLVETALKLSLHLNNAPLNGIAALDTYLTLLKTAPTPTPRALPSIPGGRLKLFLLAYEDGDDTQEGMTRAAAPMAGAGLGVFSNLALKVGERTRMVLPPECPISVGRSKTCGLVLRGDEVSREHGRIEFVNDKYFYVDESRNGSYVLTQDGTEVHVLKERIMLVGDGVISPGVPVLKQTGEVIRFRCVPVQLSLGDDAATKPRG
jgi:hypothetical protein